MDDDYEALIHNDGYAASDALKFAVELRAATHAGTASVDVRYLVLEDADAFYQWILEKGKEE